MANNETDNIKSLVYRTVDGKDLFISFLPPINSSSKKAPVYFMVPGGGWHTADQIGMFRFMRVSVRKLREEGYFVASISYRLADDGYKLNEIIEDCFFALKYLCENSESFGVDIEKIYVTGHSAGGHLALMLSYANSSDFNVDIKEDYKIIGVAALSPLTVMYKGDYQKLVGFNTDYLFADKSDDSAERIKASPITYISGKTPPTVLFAGTLDTLVFPGSSTVLYEKLEEYGLPAKLVLSEGGGHCFESLRDKERVSVSFYDVQQMTADFALEKCKPIKNV